jgi:hypothetical protein
VKPALCFTPGIDYVIALRCLQIERSGAGSGQPNRTGRSFDIPEIGETAACITTSSKNFATGQATEGSDQYRTQIHRFWQHILELEIRAKHESTSLPVDFLRSK